MPMLLRQDVHKWYCEVCHEFTEPKEPSRLTEPKSDPARPKGLWIRFVIFAAIVTALVLIRVFWT